MEAGQLIAERYALRGHLGDGGSATVWQATDQTLEREVAIKFLYVGDEREAQAQTDQFLREARLACAVQHRNVIHTMDFGTSDDGMPYMVMELLDGEALSDRLDGGERLTTTESVHITERILRGLDAIHEAGIVHRDLKPENIYIRQDEEGLSPRILDFGIARSVGGRKQPKGGRRSVLTTKEGLIIGTPEYMAPEQARGLTDVDHRADLWSAGVMLFEMLTGRLPYLEEHSGDLIIAIATTDAPRVSSLRPDITENLSEVVVRALTRDRDLRFSSAQEMREALIEAAQAQRGISTARVRALTSTYPSILRGRTVLVAGVLVAGLIIYGALQAGRTAPTTGGTAAVVETGSGRMLRVRLRGVPPGATISVNGKRVPGSELRFEDDGRARLIEVQAPGMSLWHVTHSAGLEADYDVRLTPAP